MANEVRFLKCSSAAAWQTARFRTQHASQGQTRGGAARSREDKLAAWEQNKQPVLCRLHGGTSPIFGVSCFRDSELWPLLRSHSNYLPINTHFYTACHLKLDFEGCFNSRCLTHRTMCKSSKTQNSLPTSILTNGVLGKGRLFLQRVILGYSHRCEDLYVVATLAALLCAEQRLNPRATSICSAPAAKTKNNSYGKDSLRKGDSSAGRK